MASDEKNIGNGEELISAREMLECCKASRELYYERRLNGDPLDEIDQLYIEQELYINLIVHGGEFIAQRADFDLDACYTAEELAQKIGQVIAQGKLAQASQNDGQ